MAEKDHIAKEWDNAVESWADFVRQGKDYYRDGLNNPAAFKLIGHVKGQLVLDLACGEGYNTRVMARKGAKVSARGNKAKSFSLEDQEGKLFTLSDFKEKKVLLSFHPLAWPSACSEQMNSLERNKEAFDSLNTIAV